MNMPDITKAQVLALLTFALGQAVTIGWLDPDAMTRYLQIGSAVLSAVWILGDAYLRAQRAHAMAAVHIQNAVVAQVTGIDGHDDPDV